MQAIPHGHDHQDDQDPRAAVPDQETAGEAGRPAGGWLGWLMSWSVHAVLLLIMWGIYWVVRPQEVEAPPLRTSMQEPPPKPAPVPLKHQLEDRIEIKDPVVSENPAPVTNLDAQLVDPQTEDDATTSDSQGQPDALTDSQMSGLVGVAAIGPGCGAPGMFARKPGLGHKRAVATGGGSVPSERAVNAALRWFKRHQSPDGRWDTVGFYKNCSDNPKCEPGVVDHCSTEGADVAMTGYALYCFLGAGYDHLSPSHFRSVVKKGIDYLLSVQKPDGYFGDRNYENAIATMALAQAYAMSEDPALKDPAQRGVDQILAHENQDGGAAKADSGYGTGLGWDYVGPSNRNDSSVSGWNVMALKSALAAGLKVGNGMDNAKRWLETVWKKQNPGWAGLDPYTGESRFPYTYATDTGATDIAAAPGPGQAGPNEHDLTCVGAISAVFLGHHAGDAMLESLSNYVMNHQVPRSFPCNAYYMYYNTLAIFQCGGQKWKTWNGSVRDLLVNAQRSGDGCFDGSWDYGSASFIGSEYGRVLTTAYCTLCLEVYYLYDRVSGGHPAPQR